MNSVEVRDAVKSIGRGSKKVAILNKLTMTVPPGSIFGLIGPSGCGKTTLLSCILGMIHLDGGSIRVLGLKNKRADVGRRVGYMPQETALVRELTVKETVFYFGNIFEMNPKALEERFEMIKRVLELPSDDLRVAKCSGGEKRRISFAAAIIHSPDLLILDEPTVGLDPILRERIWNFLWNETRESQLSVIITTHYTMEAQKADRVGFMRQGVLLAEDSPSHILQHCGVLSLDDAFATICVKGEYNPEKLPLVVDYQSTTPEHTERKRSSKIFRWQIVKEMMKKHFRTYRRQPALLASMLILPALQLWMVCGIFNETDYFRVAIVNDETNYSSCSRESFVIPSAVEDECQLQDASCLLMHAMSHSATVKHSSTYDGGYSLVTHGKVLAFVYIRDNFTEAINKFLSSNEKFADPFALTADITETMIDKGLTIKGNGIKSALVVANQRFLQFVLEACNRSAEYLKSPLTFESAIYGKNAFDMRSFLAHSLITCFCFFIASSLTITPFMIDRQEGFWNRTLLAGVRFREMLLAQTITFTTFIAVINIEIIVYAWFVYENTNVWSYITLYFLLLVMGCCAIFFGMFLSTVCNSMVVANSGMFSVTLSMSIMCGILVPTEIMREFFQVFAKLLPFTFPAEAVRAIMVKEFGLSNGIVQIGFLIAIGWSVLIVISEICALKIRKFSRNT